MLNAVCAGCGAVDPETAWVKAEGRLVSACCAAVLVPAAEVELPPELVEARDSAIAEMAADPEMGELEAAARLGACPNCGDVDAGPCPRCQLYGAHGGSCRHGQPLGVSFVAAPPAAALCPSCGGQGGHRPLCPFYVEPPSAVLVLSSEQQRQLAGLVESIGQALLVSPAGFRVDLGAGFAGLEAALDELEDRALDVARLLGRDSAVKGGRS